MPKVKSNVNNNIALCLKPRAFSFLKIVSKNKLKH